MSLRNSVAQIAAALVFAGVIGLAFRWSSRTPQTTTLSKEEVRTVQENPKAAVRDAGADLETAKSKRSPNEADVVARRVMSTGYAMAQKRDFKSARQAFLAVDREYSGVGSRDPDYGTIPDQAKYQSIVCLVADGKKEEAKKEFRAFLRERPTSNLAALAFRRLVRLNGGVEDPNDIALYEHALNLQAAATKRAIASCGPKVLQHYLATYQHVSPPYAEIVSVARQTEEGTSMLDMIRALVRYKVSADARELNSTDFLREPAPFIWLKDDHYVLVEKIGRTEITLWDPMQDGSHTQKPPAEDDAEFRAPILILNP